MSTAFEWSPFLPRAFTMALIAFGLVLVLAAILFRRQRDFFWRGLFFLLLAFLLLNPIMLHELRQSLPDKLVVVLDESPSMRIGGRDKAAGEALEDLLDKVKLLKGVEPIVIRSGADAAAGKGESTKLFAALEHSLMSIPLSQVAGTVFITDGQVHDVPAEAGALSRLAPFHVLLAGKKDEFDRKVTIVSAPKYGVLNENVAVSVKVEESGNMHSGALPLTVYAGGKKTEEVEVTPGETREFSFKVEHPGQNVYEFAVPVAEGELTPANNRAPVIVNGIRDRLRVLLVSGSPHMGERAWRNLLKSDPAVDLIHFTILRAPDSMDMTPPMQMSLIPFPIDELFSQRINDFDMIVFDRFQNYDYIMRTVYFNKIVAYVQRGGALLVAMGTGNAEQTLSGTPLQQIVPVDVGATPLIMRGAYVPTLTELGRAHPVTADLQRQYAKRKWGAWFTQIDARNTKGSVLMTGGEGKPLLVLDKAGEGRVAVLSSDNIWLWSKGLAQAGPYTDLLRNVAHWLMKEPELEDDFIKADASDNKITVAERDLSPEEKTAVMTTPSGATQEVHLSNRIPGWITADVPAEESGIYSFDNGHKKAFAVIGAARSEEFSDVLTTEEKLKPVVDQSHGGMIWFQENRGYSLKNVAPTAGVMGGSDWLGVKRNNAYNVDNVESRSLIPNWLSLLIIFGAAVWTWWRESGVRKSR
jgi:hypothetical protein